MKRRRLKKKFVIFFSLYFILLISYLVSFTFSKFTSSINKTSTLEVAKWDVSISGESNVSLNVISGNTTENLETQSYILSVTSVSEVSSKYSIKISNLPDGVQISIDNGEILTSNNNEIEIEDVGSFMANDLNTTHNHTITFMALDSVEETINQQIDIDVIFTQDSL